MIADRKDLPKIYKIFVSKFEDVFGDTEFVFDTTLFLYPKLDIKKWMKNEYGVQPSFFVKNLSKLMSLTNIEIDGITYYGGEEELMKLMNGLNECINSSWYKEEIYKIYLTKNNSTGRPVIKVSFYTETDLNTSSEIILRLMECRNKMGYNKPGIIEFT